MTQAPDTRDGASLIGRLLRIRPRVERHGWRVAVAVALLGAAGPVLTISGAAILEDRQRTERMELERDTRVIAARAAEARDTALRRLLTRPAFGTTIDGLARALPADAALSFAEMSEDGAVRIEVAAPDPDRLRTALRRDPTTAAFRDAGQRRGEGVMLVTLERAR